MATYQENIRKIRGEAIYGADMREAIAEAITQAADLDVGEIDVYVTVEAISNNDYRMEFVLSE